jgi:DNA-binding transcriptional regulator GbsR (MarR family)
MNKNLDKAYHNFIEGIGHLSSSLGFSKVMGQLYALLYLSNKPLSLDDMVKRLAISKGSASINIRELKEKGAVKKIWMKGSRKDFYGAETDLAKIVRGRITLSARWRMDEVRNIIQKSEELLQNAKENSNDNEDKRKIKFYNQRLKEMKRLYKRANNLLGKFLLFTKAIKF